MFFRKSTRRLLMVRKPAPHCECPDCLGAVRIVPCCRLTTRVGPSWSLQSATPRANFIILFHTRINWFQLAIFCQGKRIILHALYRSPDCECPDCLRAVRIVPCCRLTTRVGPSWSLQSATSRTVCVITIKSGISSLAAM